MTEAEKIILDTWDGPVLMDRAAMRSMKQPIVCVEVQKDGTEKIILDTWDGPVLVGKDAYFWELEGAIDRYCDDDLDDIPELCECCDEVRPSFDASDVLDHIDGNCGTDESWFSDSVHDEHLAKLQQFIDAWIAEVDWHIWRPNGKYLRFRELVSKCAS